MEEANNLSLVCLCFNGAPVGFSTLRKQDKMINVPGNSVHSNTDFPIVDQPPCPKQKLLEPLIPLLFFMLSFLPVGAEAATFPFSLKPHPIVFPTGINVD